MVTQEILGKDLQLKVTDDSDSLQEIEGITSYSFDKEYTDTDTTSNDEDGDATSLPVKIGRSFSIEGKRKEDGDGNLATGQALLVALSDKKGHNAVREYKFLTQDGSALEVTFDAWIELGTELTAGHEEHATWSATVHVNGTPSYLPSP